MQNIAGKCDLCFVRKAVGFFRRKEAQGDGLTTPSPQIPSDRTMKTVMNMIKAEKPQGYQTWYRYLYKDF